MNKKKVRLTAKNAIGKGGEADVFKWGRNQAIKVFKSPEHPDFVGIPEAQQAARDRLDQHQHKLRQFPPGLPARVISPTELALDKNGQRILGYTMPLLKDTDVLLRYGDRTFRQAIDAQNAQTVVQIFLDLHQTITQLHRANVVIGDFNDLNVLVKGTAAYIIDADSFQFGSFTCPMFTARFVDPLLCDPTAPQPILQQSHSPASDWYAFAVMLMQCLLFVDPYGGIYKPKDKRDRIPQSARSLKRITVFHPEVRYPKPALPWDRLPDDLLHHFHHVFEQDWRGEFPRSLLENLQWTTCTHCGVDHARSHCPCCTAASPVLTPPPLPIQTEVVHGKVIVTHLFTTEGLILVATSDQGTLSWVYWEQGQFKREDGAVLLDGPLQANLRWRLQGKNTLIGHRDQVVCLTSAQSATLVLDQPSLTSPQPSPWQGEGAGGTVYSDSSRTGYGTSRGKQRAIRRLAVESYEAIAQFDVNASHRYWIDQGQLLRDNPLPGDLADDSTVTIGTVLPGGHTQIWVGNTFGFGFYRAGDLNGAFVFDAHRPGINDQVQLPRWQGTLIHTTCTFSDRPASLSKAHAPTPSLPHSPTSYCWLFLTTQEQGIIHYRCIVLSSTGAVVAEAIAPQGSDHWLTQLGASLSLDPCPYHAAGQCLLAATDVGIIRVEIQNSQIVHTKTFPDTEPFVDATCRLLPAPLGLYVVSPHQIHQLQLT